MDQAYKDTLTFITAHHFWTAAKETLCRKYTDDLNVLSFLDNMMVLGFFEDAGLEEYTISILMKDRSTAAELKNPEQYDYLYVTLKHDQQKNSIFTCDYEGDGYDMSDYYGKESSNIVNNFINFMMRDEEQITHEQMSDIVLVLFDYFPVIVDF